MPKIRHLLMLALYGLIIFPMSATADGVGKLNPNYVRQLYGDIQAQMGRANKAIDKLTETIDRRTEQRQNPSETQKEDGTNRTETRKNN